MNKKRKRITVVSVSLPVVAEIGAYQSKERRKQSSLLQSLHQRCKELAGRDGV